MTQAKIIKADFISTLDEQPLSALVILDAFARFPEDRYLHIRDDPFSAKLEKLGNLKFQV